MAGVTGNQHQTPEARRATLPTANLSHVPVSDFFHWTARHPLAHPTASSGVVLSAWHERQAKDGHTAGTAIDSGRHRVRTGTDSSRRHSRAHVYTGPHLQRPTSAKGHVYTCRYFRRAATSNTGQSAWPDPGIMELIIRPLELAERRPTRQHVPDRIIGSAATFIHGIVT